MHAAGNLQTIPNMEVRASFAPHAHVHQFLHTHTHMEITLNGQKKKVTSAIAWLTVRPSQASPRPSHASGDRPGPDVEWRTLGGQHGNHQSAESPEALSSPPLSMAIMIGQFRPRSPAFPVDERPGTSPGLARGRRPAGHATGTRSLTPNRYRVTPNETSLSLSCPRRRPRYFC
jgi:hypothetical protein